MSKLILLWLTMAVGMIFLALPYSTDVFDFFPASDQLLTTQTYVWFLCQRLVMIVLAFIIYNESDLYRLALLTYLLIQVLKFLDYLICYNEVWVRIWNVPFSSNTLGILVFGLAIAYEFIWKNRE